MMEILKLSRPFNLLHSTRLIWGLGVGDEFAVVPVCYNPSAVAGLVCDLFPPIDSINGCCALVNLGGAFFFDPSVEMLCQTITAQFDGCPTTDEITLNTVLDLFATFEVTNPSIPEFISAANGVNDFACELSQACFGFPSQGISYCINYVANSPSYTIHATPIANAGPDATFSCTDEFLLLDGTASSEGPSITYEWSTDDGTFCSETDNIITTPCVLESGIYTLQVSNIESNCTATDEVEVFPPPTIKANISEQEDVSCFGQNDGSATVTASGGSAPYSYVWTNGDTTAMTSQLMAGEHCVTIFDNDSCSTFVCVTINEPDAITVNASATDETFAGANDGTATANPSGGTEPYTYLWSNGQTTQMISNLAPDEYCVTATDDNNCTAEQCVTVAPGAANCDTGPFITQACDDGDPCTENDEETVLDDSSGTVCIPCTGTTVATCTVPPMMQSCDDGNPCTENDMESIDPCDGTTICVPCTGTIVDCDTPGATTTQACDDGNANTVNDMETILTCDGSVCTPCAGTTTSCENDPTTTQPCDDGNPCTLNDTETILQSDGSICEPCTGTPAPCDTDASCEQMQACDDGDPCTENDMEIVLQSDGSTCEPCAGTPIGCETAGATTTQPCDDGNPNTINDMETILTCDGSVCVPCIGTEVDCSDPDATTVQACDDDNPCTINDMETILNADGSICEPCTGTPAPCDTDASCEQMQACDDGDPCTENDVEIVLQSDGSICQPCAGTPIGCETAGATTTQPCDDGNPNTINDMETILTCDGSVCVPCIGTEVDCSDPDATTVQPCDDGNPCTLNDTETILQSDGSICEPCTGTPAPCDTNASCEQMQACDDGDPCTENDMEIVLQSDGSICQPCAGTPIGCETPGATTTQPCDDGNANTENDTQVVLDCDGSICVPCTGIPIDCTASAGEISSNDETTFCTDDGEDDLVEASLDGGMGASSTWIITDIDGNILELPDSPPFNFEGVEAGTCVIWHVYYDDITGLETGLNAADLEGCFGLSNSIEIIRLTGDDCDPACDLSVEVVSSTDVLCNGEANGTATAEISGGTGPYTISWMTSSSISETATDLPAGVATVSVMDAEGCTAENFVTIEEPDVLVVNTSTSNESSAGAMDGSATAEPDGGTEPYSYVWSTGDDTQSISGQAAGTYDVTVTDANGCVDTGSATIGVGGGADLNIDVSTTDATCFGDSDGTASLTINGGVGPYSIEWSSGEVDVENVSGLAAGTYSVTVTDANGDSDVAYFAIHEPIMLKADVAYADIACYGESTGSILVNGWGGVEPYTYQWNTGDTDNSLHDLAAGTYSVTVTDANGCTAEETIELTEPEELLANATGMEETSPGAGGTATADPSGGVPPYSYSWNTGQTTQTIDGLELGEYTVIVMDANFCTTTQTVVVGPAPQPLQVNVFAMDARCFDSNDGSATADVSGGVLPYTYNWSNGASTISVDNLPPGDYTLIVSDMSGVSASADFSISQPEALSVDIVNLLDETCKGSADGTVTIVAAGGTSPYSYAWPSGNLGETESGLSEGTYTAMVTDVNNCETTLDIDIAIADNVSPDLVVQNVVVLLDENGVGQVEGAQFDNGSSDNCSIEDISVDMTTFDCSQLGANTVTVTATDGNNNTTSLSATVTVMDELAPTVITQNLTVFLDENGQAQISVDDIDNGSYDNCAISARSLDVSTFDCSNLGDNLVTLTVADVNGNDESQPAMVTVIDDLAPSITCANDILSAACGEAIEYDLPVALDNCSAVTPVLIEGLGSGAIFPEGETTETYMVVDESGNEATCSFTVSVVNDLNISVDGVSDETGSNIADGSIDISVQGGVEPYTYQWTLDGEVFSTEEDLTGLSGGEYVLQVIDANGCELFTETIVVSTLTNTDELDLVESLQLFPNPTTGNIQLQIDLTASSSIQVVMHDITGKTLFTEQQEQLSSAQYSWDLSEYANGVYLIKIIIDDAVITKRITLQKN